MQFDAHSVTLLMAVVTGCSGTKLVAAGGNSIVLRCMSFKSEVISVTDAQFGTKSDCGNHASPWGCKQNRHSNLRQWCDGRKKCIVMVTPDLFHSVCGAQSPRCLVVQYTCKHECPPTKWGSGCSKDCSLACKDQKCDPVDGVCFECPSGKAWPQCTKDCSAVVPRSRCSSTCFRHCMNKQRTLCNSPNAEICKCAAGYEGDTCSNVCSASKYGSRCKQTCSSNCAGPNNPCDHRNGTCTFGCQPGYVGEKCDSAMLSTPAVTTTANQPQTTKIIKTSTPALTTIHPNVTEEACNKTGVGNCTVPPPPDNPTDIAPFLYGLVGFWALCGICAIIAILRGKKVVEIDDYRQSGTEGWSSFGSKMDGDKSEAGSSWSSSSSIAITDVDTGVNATRTSRVVRKS